MKSYIQGLVTGGVLIFAFMVLTGQKHGHKDNHGHHDIDDIMHKLEDLEDKLKKIEIGVYCYNVDQKRTKGQQRHPLEKYEVNR